ncbi:ATP-dependent RNA helicase [Wickerhamomyces ciferrii]|uniref:ATP-dependent RNA helicase DRS1 n=1 Tax=Wickerhamomyces ciferrii (strain ATCC 14091 / BCRC 22168 / CBS 111 / JCM 3599 / NBRC 0793 / NRRL Y-1031 F-60-10) TaxID=1206466 RepID=K0KPQ1_WICCF|nr:ATP-dependent RNA helicase [Wickerhamomyces ciferrii]CCH43143.1 ATP-dependent RNA helicase [Wickerhamomyces ciferrii]
MGRFDDFVPTISDSEDDIPDYDIDEESASESELKPVKSDKKNKKKKKNSKNTKVQEDDDEAKDEDLNHDFVFDLDGEEVVSTFEGWDFKGDEQKENGKKDVDLDGIIRRKGGLGQLAGSKQDDSEEEEEDEEEEDEQEEEAEEEEQQDDDDLALDGFGMGVEKKQDNEDDDQESENESEDEDESEPEPKVQELKDDGAESSPEDEEDSPEDMAKFYAPTEEADQAKKQIHKTFQSLDLSRPILKGLSTLGYQTPSPIQSATIPIALLGKDIIAGAVTGSGKTAAYMIPVIERLLYKPAKLASTRVIVLTPTRELAIQVNDVGKKIGKFVNGLSFGLAVGGLNLRQQEQELKQRPDIVIATPGRIIDHLRNSPSFNVDGVEILIVDEADRMLEEGFQKELTEILDILPTKRQTLLFSATMNSKIKSLIQLSLKKPVRIMIDPPKQAATGLVQEFVRIRKRDHLKPSILFNILKKFTKDQRIVIFVARKEQAHKLRIILGLLGLKVSELHGSLTQEQRLQSINNFKTLTVPILICTDLASRGLDIPKIEVVLNFDMPKNFEVYLHRVGRTARGGREGKSISFVGESSMDRSIVKDAIKSSQNMNSKVNKTVGREVNWKEVEEINKIIESKNEILEEILVEEKTEKEMIQAEMELRKGENLLRYKEEIQSRPRRTWFEKESEKGVDKNIKLSKEKPKLNAKKRKQQEARDELSGERSYKKTKNDRMSDQKRQNKKSNKKGKKK